MIAKTITRADTTRTIIKTPYDENGFTFRPDADIEFAKSDNPEVDEIIPIVANEKNFFKKAISFFVKGVIWTNIFLAPYKSKDWSDGWWSAECNFDWVYQTPIWAVSWTTCQEWIDLHFPSQPPTMSLRWTPAFWLYEVGTILTTPLIEWRGALWSNPAGVLTNLTITDPVFAQVNPTPWTWYWANDVNINIILWTTKTFNWNLTDDQWRNTNASWNYRWALPFYYWVITNWDIFDWITRAELLALPLTLNVKTKSDTNVTTNPIVERFIIWYPAAHWNLTSIIDNSWFETISDYDIFDYDVVWFDWNTVAYRFYVLKSDTTQTSFTNQYIF